VFLGSWNGVAEPDFDGCDVDGSLVDGLAFVEACGHSAELAEFVDAALDGVAFLVAFGVEGGWTAAGRAAVALCVKLG
jgi:hypothetical protein